MPQLTRIVTQLFSLDLRALALMRISLALAVIVDLLLRARFLSVNYGSGSVLPLELLEHSWLSQGFWTLHLLFESHSWIVVLFAIEGLAACCLLLGYRTRISAAITYILSVSLAHANILIVYGGDSVMNILLFFTIFLPVAARYSVDALRTESDETNYISVWSAAFVMQIIVMYLSASLLKSGFTWHSGSAVYYTLSIDQFRTSFGTLIYQFPALMAFLTVAVLTLQKSIVILFLFPWRTDVVRTTAIVLLILMHIGFVLSLHIGLFSWITITALVALLPSRLFDAFTNWLANRGLGGLSIFYDEECGFCRKSSWALKMFLLLPNTQVLPAQPHADIYAKMRSNDSWVVIDGEQHQYFTYPAGIRILAASPLLFWLAPLMALPMFRSFGEKCYRFVASHRGNTCSVNAPEPHLSKVGHFASATKVALSILGATYIVVIAVWNASTFTDTEPMNYLKDQVLGYPLIVLGLNQKWDMFAPNPPFRSMWLIAKGTFEDNTQLNLYPTPRPLSYEKPRNQFPDYYSTERQTKFATNMARVDANKFALPYFAKYLCDQTYDTLSPLREVSLIAMTEDTLPNYKRIPYRRTLLNYTCGTAIRTDAFAPVPHGSPSE